jgi:hypothetical protein
MKVITRADQNFFDKTIYVAAVSATTLNITKFMFHCYLVDQIDGNLQKRQYAKIGNSFNFWINKIKKNFSFINQKFSE